MANFFSENPLGTLFGFCVLLIAIYYILELIIYRNKPIVQCSCNCHDDLEEEEDTK